MKCPYCGKTGQHLIASLDPINSTGTVYCIRTGQVYEFKMVVKEVKKKVKKKKK